MKFNMVIKIKTAYHTTVQVDDAVKSKQPSSTSISIHALKEDSGQNFGSLSHNENSVTKASNLLQNPSVERLSSPTIIHATPSTDHDYTAKVNIISDA